MQLSILQSFIKKSPETYREEFISQFQYFRNELEILSLNPSKDSTRLTELLDFESQVVPNYPDFHHEFIDVLLELLATRTESLHPTIRFKIFQSLAIVHRQIDSDPTLVLKLSFQLLSIHDKPFRAYVTEFILTEVKRIQTKKQYASDRNAIQSFIHSVIGDSNSPIAFRCVEILTRLYRKKIWTDGRTVNILGLACFHSESKVYLGAINFFLGIESALAADEEDDDKEAKKVEINKFEHSKKTKKRARLIEKQKAQLAKKLSGKDSKNAQTPLYPAIMLINDPHSLAEHLFRKLKQGSEGFEKKLLLMNMVSQLIGCHKLLLLNFYSFLQKYLASHSANVTNILAFLAQSCHDMVPPSEIVPVIRTIANNFVSDRASEESITVGINSIREVIGRVPSVLLEDDMDGFIQDLAQYGHKNKKYVVAAARSLINLVREHHPKLLKKADRGRFTDKSKTPQQFGEIKVATVDDMNGESTSEDEWEEDGSMDDTNVEDADGSDGDWESVVSEVDDMDDEHDEEEEEPSDSESENDGVDEEEAARSRKRVRIDDTQSGAEDELEDAEEEESGASQDDSDSENEDTGADYKVDPSALLPQGKVHKATKIERLKQILSGRVEKRFQHEGHAGGLTNKEKTRKKNFVMVRRGKRSVALKKRTSVQERRWRKQGKKEQYGRDKRKRRRV